MVHDDFFKETIIPNIELRGEDVQELMGRKPSFILRHGIGTVLFLLLCFLVASKCIPYPEMIKVDVFIEDSSIKQNVIVPEGKWMVKYIIPKMETSVRKGDTIMVIANMNDTIEYVCCFDGLAYKSFNYKYGDLLRTNDVVMVIIDSSKQSDKMEAYSLLNKHICEKIKIGMKMKIDDNGLCFSVKEKSKIPNIDGMYTVCYETTDANSNYIVSSDKLEGRIVLGNSNVFDKLFSQGLNKLIRKSKKNESTHKNGTKAY